MKLLILYLIIVIALAGCSSSTVEVTDLANSLEPVEEGKPYPYPAYTQEFYVPPYPVPSEQGVVDLANQYIVPTPDPNTGVVIGSIFHLESKEPISNQTIYLGKKVPSTSGEDYTYTIQELSSPHTITDNDGRFAIGSVEPGTFIILVWSPNQIYVIPGENGEPELEISVKAGELLDVGDLSSPYLK